MVFDGHAAPYRSTDMPNPTNLYGQTKLMAERKVWSTTPRRPVVLRIPILMGKSRADSAACTKNTGNRGAASSPDCLRRDPPACSADNVAEVLLELGERRDLHGIFHWAGSETLSRFEMEQRAQPFRPAARRHRIGLQKRRARIRRPSLQPDLRAQPGRRASRDATGQLRATAGSLTRIEPCAAERRPIVPLLILPNAYGDAATNMAIVPPCWNRFLWASPHFAIGWLELAMTFGYAWRPPTSASWPRGLSLPPLDRRRAGRPPQRLDLRADPAGRAVHR